MQVRVCVPVWSQVDEKPPHEPQPPHEVLPQVSPSVSREQVRDSVALLPPHEPLEQVKSVRVRVCVPPSSHVPEKPPHEPQPVYVELEHVTPLVLRVQACVSGVLVG